MEYFDPILSDRFWAKVHVVANASTFPGPCWIWSGSKNDRGYGKMNLAKRLTYAHRISLSAHLGRPVDASLQVDHRCRVRLCVNPAHLEEVTARVNLLRGNTITARNASRTHCPRGHEYSEGNLEKSGLKKGWRMCIKCRRLLARERKATR